MDTGGESFTGESFYCSKLFEFDTKSHIWKEVIPESNDNENIYIPVGRRSHSTGRNRLKFYFFILV